MKSQLKISTLCPVVLSLGVTAEDTIFTKLDLCNAYHLVAYHLVPEVFQAPVNDILRDFMNHFVFVYLGNFLMFPNTLSDHENPVCLVLQWLLEKPLFVKGEKCKFHICRFHCGTGAAPGGDGRD